MDEKALLKQLKAKVDAELRQLELETVSFWLDEVKKIAAKRHQDFASLHNDLKNLITRMENRLKTIKTPER